MSFFDIPLFAPRHLISTKVVVLSLLPLKYRNLASHTRRSAPSALALGVATLATHGNTA